MIGGCVLISVNVSEFTAIVLLAYYKKIIDVENYTLEIVIEKILLNRPRNRELIFYQSRYIHFKIPCI